MSNFRDFLEDRSGISDFYLGIFGDDYFPETFKGFATNEREMSKI
jgi:hypothetical protein